MSRLLFILPEKRAKLRFFKLPARIYLAFTVAGFRDIDALYA